MCNHDKYWNKCSHCGQFISFDDFDTGKAHRQCTTPDSDFTVETWDNCCNKCKPENKYPDTNIGGN